MTPRVPLVLSLVLSVVVAVASQASVAKGEMSIGYLLTFLIGTQKTSPAITRMG